VKETVVTDAGIVKVRRLSGTSHFNQSTNSYNDQRGSHWRGGVSAMMTQVVLNMIFRDCSILKSGDEKKEGKKSKKGKNKKAK